MADTTEPAGSNAEATSRGRYYEKRNHLMYYRYVERIVTVVAGDAQSIIDVGSHDTSCLDVFDWAPKRWSLDLLKPYTSEHVHGIKADFFKYEPPAEKFDLAICLQVLEHLQKAEEFAKKLFDVGHSVLISVPYKWPPSTTHFQDPVDEAKLASWTGREPDYAIVVQEPIAALSRGRRIIAYYHRPDQPFSMREVRRAWRAKSREPEAH